MPSDNAELQLMEQEPSETWTQAVCVPFTKEPEAAAVAVEEHSRFERRKTQGQEELIIKTLEGIRSAVFDAGKTALVLTK